MIVVLQKKNSISSSYEIFYNELNNVKQVLFNNGFPNYFVDKQIKLMIKNWNKITKSYVTQNNYNHINLWYCNQTHPNFKLDEKILKNLIRRYTSPI